MNVDTLFLIAFFISKNVTRCLENKSVNVSFTSLSNISKYKKVVSEVIIVLENKKHQFDAFLLFLIPFSCYYTIFMVK